MHLLPSDIFFNAHGLDRLRTQLLLTASTTPTSAHAGTSDEAQGKGAGIVGMLMPVVAWDEQQYGAPDPASTTSTATGAVKVAAAPAHAQAEVDGLAADLLAATVFASLSTNNSNGGSVDNTAQPQQQDMPMLMQSLFAALHAEYGDGADPK